MNTEKVRKDFSKRLVTRMLAQGMNQSELARRAGLGRDNISGYATGKNLPNSAHLNKLANALRVEPGWLLGAKALEERYPGMAEDPTPVFRMEELPDEPDIVQVTMKKRLTRDAYRKLLDILEDGRKK